MIDSPTPRTFLIAAVIAATCGHADMDAACRTLLEGFIAVMLIIAG